MKFAFSKNGIEYAKIQRSAEMLSNPFSIVNTLNSRAVLWNNLNPDTVLQGLEIPFN